MPVYIALLRGINIGPHKRIKMEKLRAGCEGMKLGDVKTYVQSGNIVFRAAKQSPTALTKKIEAMIVDEFGFSARVVVRTDGEMAAVVRNNPFLPEKRICRQSNSVSRSFPLSPRKRWCRSYGHCPRAGTVPYPR